MRGTFRLLSQKEPQKPVTLRLLWHGCLIIAYAIRNIFNEEGTRFPKSDKIPIANAMSVAIGMPAPASGALNMAPMY